jgi:hypothetical protein
MSEEHLTNVRWIDVAEVLADEEKVRVDQESQLADVLELADELATLFVPEVAGKELHLTPQLAALVALETGLFGYLRSIRAATRDGRAQDIITAARTIDEIHKRVVIALADPEIAARLASNEHFSSKALDEAYERELVKQGKSRRAEERDRASTTFSKQSWILHGRHAGLQFLVVVDGAGKPTITRMPRAATLPSRGRDLALHALSVVAAAVQLVVPPILEALGVDIAEWSRRHRAIAERLDLLSLPYLAAGRVRAEQPDAKVEVDASGQLIVDGEVVAVRYVDEEQAT